MTAQPKHHYGAFAPVGPVGQVDAPREVRRQPGFYVMIGKRVFDIFVVLCLSLSVVPLIAVLAVLIVVFGGGSPFYWNDRLGRGGRTFRMLKLRTMVPDAHERLEAYLAADPEARREWESSQKLKNDPRVTPIGRVLRKTSLDELPQLWNVLRGDMSLVGPRPMMPSQRSMYPGLAYFALRPGMTGPWQVSDRNESEFAARARFDQDYAVRLSFREDLSLLARTVSVVFRGTGY